MEEFDFEKWKTGDYDVVTRNGKSVRIICTDRKSDTGKCIVALSEFYYSSGEVVEYFPESGIFNDNKSCSGFDLMLVKKQWKPKDGDWFYYISGGYMPMVYKSRFDSEFNSHQEMILMGNSFQTKEEAEKKVCEILELLKK